MGTPYENIIRKLKEKFPGWDVDIKPPPQGPVSGYARQIEGSGSMRYRFAESEKGLYLEYYQFHRIWGDSHARIYASGEVERLDVLGSVMVMTGDPDKDQQQREALHQRNQRLIVELETAGLLSGGPVPGSFTINAAIVTGTVDPDEDPPPKQG